MPFTKYSLLDQSYFFTSYLSIAHIKFINYSPIIFLRLPSSELLEKHLFRSRANRRLVTWVHNMIGLHRLHVRLGHRQAKQWA